MEFQIEKAVPEAYEDVICIIQEVLSSMPNQKWFAADAPDYTYKILSEGRACAYLARCKDTGQIAGIFIADIPGASYENLGLDAGLSGDALMKVAHMDTAAVLPAYRGYGLQKRLMLAAEKDLKASGYCYLCCTIHPENKYSMNSARSLGYEVVKICEKYGGYLRAVLIKKIGLCSRDYKS